MKIFLPSILLSSVGFTSASAAVLTLAPGAARTDDPVTGVNDWTLDAGLVVRSLPASPNRIVFEAGGDGTGSSLALIGNELVYYHDKGAFDASSPAGDAFFALDISSFSGSVISLRLDADLSGGTDTVTLTATNGSASISDAITLGANESSIAGGNDTGFGVVAQDLGGLDESVEAGSPDMMQFQNANYFAGGRMRSERTTSQELSTPLWRISRPSLCQLHQAGASWSPSPER